ncbi:uncharacterized protein LOC116123438 [Pistacia vera]|uniref:uncharacterized protein LOC116118076 n=1 Tax=Pistacia vera TaxID=55513 RepID=UPI001263B06B|nr:uncharacterized protein LOC116118076 [Pistacia vera]XP_031265071.1 uncharacterized protein LOC116123438 [Pistacia vera]
MSEAPKSFAASRGHGKVGPDYFGYYTCEVKELLSQDEDFLPFTVQTPEMSKRKCGEVRGQDTIDGRGSGASSSFSDSIGAGLSDFKKERLKSLLRQGVFDLTPEVDEMLDPVIAMCQLQSQIRNKKSLSSDIGTASKGHAVEVPFKKHKTSSSFSSTSIPAHPNPLNSESCKEVDGDLQFLLENDSLQVEEMLKKYFDELSATLGHMEQQLEELLNAVVSKCRPMTLSEKHELRKMIQKLPPNNLDRVVEIVRHNKSAEPQSSDEYFVDLEKEDNITLWRLYYYVKAVQKARELLA